MRRFIMIFSLFLMMLSGCAKENASFDLNKSIETQLSYALETSIHDNWYGKRYYSYYKEPSVGRLDANEVSDLFIYDGVRFIMTLNTENVVNEVYYNQVADTYEDETGLTVMANGNGTYLDRSNTEQAYHWQVYEWDDACFVKMWTPCVTYYAFSNERTVPRLLRQMMVITRSVSVHQDEVLADYSKKENLTGTSKTLELFDSIAPESGSIEELFLDSTGTSQGTATDENTENEYHGRIDSDDAVLE